MNEDALANIQRQNDVIITLLARLVWAPEKLAAIVTRGKRNPTAYRRVYNALDGDRTGQSLASLAPVTQQAISYVLQIWEKEGIVTNVGTSSKPRYRKLMTIPKKGKAGEN